ncbi:MAG: T9SS type A sorting domain-containing protein [bacterium]|nr:T9SS type A sorting domain-containing protein [bacterium]
MTTSEAYAAVELPSGDYILAGNAHSSLPPRERPFLAGISASGSVQWVRRLAMTDVTLVSSVFLCHDGGYLVAGYTEDDMRDMVILKTTAQGDSVWRWTHGLGQPVDRVSDIVETLPGRFVLSGWVMWGDENRVYLAALEGAGQLSWERMYGSSRGNYAMTTDLIQTHDGGFAVAGAIGDGPFGLDMYLVRFQAEEGVAREHTVINEFCLLTAYPNPFNSVCTIVYELPRPAEVEFAVYDVTGRLVRQHVLGQQSSGEHEWFLNGSGMATGTYFVRLSAGGPPVQTQKVLLVK